MKTQIEKGVSITLSFQELLTIHDCLVIGAGWRKMQIALNNGVPISDQPSVQTEELEKTIAISHKFEDLMHSSDLLTLEYHLTEIKRG